MIKQVYIPKDLAVLGQDLYNSFARMMLWTRETAPTKEQIKTKTVPQSQGTLLGKKQFPLFIKAKRLSVERTIKITESELTHGEFWIYDAEFVDD